MYNSFAAWLYAAVAPGEGPTGDGLAFGDTIHARVRISVPRWVILVLSASRRNSILLRFSRVKRFKHFPFKMIIRRDLYGVSPGLCYTFSNVKIPGKPLGNLRKPTGPAAGKPTRPDIQRQRLIEEFATLDREVANYKPKIQKHEKLRQLILDWYRDLPAEEEVTVPGLSCDVLISARDNVRSVTPEGKKKLFRLWGPKAFIARSLVLLKALPDPKDEKGLYTVQAPAGPRHLHVMARANAAQQSSAA